MSSQPLAYLSSPVLFTCVEACIISFLDIPTPFQIQSNMLVCRPCNHINIDFEDTKLKLLAVL